MAKKEEKVSFEEALQELESITEKLERGQLTLEESIKAYERGMELKKICTERLKEAEGKIEYLSNTPEGKAVKESAKRDKPKVIDKLEEDDLF